MKRPISYITALLIGMSITACHKDDNVTPPAPPPNVVYDTIFPSEYFPVYPGSYWKYVDENGDTTSHSTSASYQLIPTTHTDGVPNHYYYLSLYDNLPVKFNLISNGNMDWHSDQWTMLFPPDPHVNDYFGGGFYQGMFLPPTDSIVQMGATCTVGGMTFDSVMVITSEMFAGDHSVLKWTYYAKGVGIVKTEHTNNGTVHDESHVFEYFVND